MAEHWYCCLSVLSLFLNVPPSWLNFILVAIQIIDHFVKLDINMGGEEYFSFQVIKKDIPKKRHLIDKIIFNTIRKAYFSLRGNQFPQTSHSSSVRMFLRLEDDLRLHFICYTTVPVSEYYSNLSSGMEMFSSGEQSWDWLIPLGSSISLSVSSETLYYLSLLSAENLLYLLFTQSKFSFIM